METIQIEEIKKSEVPTVPGTPLAGGFYYGQAKIDGDTFALVVSPKNEGEFTGPWGSYGTKIDAGSVVDGLKNTLAMAASGLTIALQAQALVINDKSDWYIPSRDELEILYRALKPTSEENWCSWRDGENTNAVPPTAAYTESDPAQTPVPEFQNGGAEALPDGWHWTSTQVSAYGAASHNFSLGDQSRDVKLDELRVRVVRRLKIV